MLILYSDRTPKIKHVHRESMSRVVEAEYGDTDNASLISTERGRRAVERTVSVPWRSPPQYSPGECPRYELRHQPLANSGCFRSRSERNEIYALERILVRWLSSPTTSLVGPGGS